MSGMRLEAAGPESASAPGRIDGQKGDIRGSDPLGVRARRIVAPVLLLAGAAFVALGVLRGSASASVVVIVPLFTGSSLLFLLGVLCLGIGFVTLPLALWDGGSVPDAAEAAPEEGGRPGAPNEEGTDRFAGAVVIGPVPILVGRWKDAPAKVRWAIALAGVVLLVIVLFFAFPFRW